MAFENQPNMLDKTYEFGGLKVYIDQASMLYLDGAEVDYVETLEGAGFKFNNPHVNLPAAAAAPSRHKPDRDNSTFAPAALPCRRLIVVRRNRRWHGTCPTTPVARAGFDLLHCWMSERKAQWEVRLSVWKANRLHQ